MRTACSLIVMPRSRSRSMVSRTWSCISRWLMAPVRSSRRSASVDLPWSMWAMMQKFRTRACLVVTATVRMLGIVSATLVIGGLIAVVGVVLLLNLLGAGDFVMRTVTSRYLGSLPPGFAASKSGFRVYAALVIAIGLLFAGFGVAELGRLRDAHRHLALPGLVAPGLRRLQERVPRLRGAGDRDRSPLRRLRGRRARATS